LNNKILYKIIILFSFLASLTSYAQREAIEFDRISVEDGLSQGTVYSILQDHKGFMWFGTEDGLNRFDGYSFKVFKFNPYQKGSLSNNRVISLIEDKENNIWIGTIGGGLVKYDHQTETFNTYKHNPDDSQSLSLNRVMALSEDPSGKIWVGTAEEGLNLFDPKTEKFKVYKNFPENPNTIPDNIIRSLYIDSNQTLYVGTNKGFCYYNSNDDNFITIKVYDKNGKHYPVGVVRRFLEDSDGDLWIATDDDGLIKYDREKRAFDIFIHDENEKGLASNTIHDLYQDDEGSIWIASYAGLQKFNPKTKQFKTYINNITNPRSISSNLIRTIYEDRTGIVWIGTYNHGINKFDRKHRKFTNYHNQPGDPLSLPSSIIRSIFEDSQGKIWIGTFGEGLVMFDIESEGFTHFTNNALDKNSLVNNYVTSIVQDFDNNIWISTYNGLSKYNPSKKSFKTFIHNPDDINSLPDNKMRYLYIDKNNTLWIATLANGLCMYDQEKNVFIKYTSNPENPKATLSQDRLMTMYEDNYNNFWVGTSGEGLNLFDRRTGTVRQFKNDINDSTSISSNRIYCLYHDNYNRLWIGTDEGLNLFNYDNETFTAYRSYDGLPNDVIYGILEDNNGELWVSTNNGISHFNPNDNDKIQFNNYYKSDGLQNNEFSEGAYLKTKSGLLFFGGISNFNVIDPNNIKDNPFPPEVYITELRIINKNAKFDEQKEDIINLLNKDFIELDHNRNNLSFYFTALHYSYSKRNKYKYRLEGFESSWVEPIENQRFATYTNLKPGKYKFMVIASNPDGVWNEKGDEFIVNINNPFWKTWWFLVFTFILTVGLIIGTIFLREANLKKNKRELEEMVSIRTAEIQQQAERLRHANEEIIATSDVLSEQNKQLQEKNEEISSQHNELENQRNALANLAWELQEKNEEIEKQKDLLASQTKEITDSIMYAKRIQQAVLPMQEQIRDLFSEFFIFNRPKSIVSGDFYWATRVGNNRIVASVDCTGHGVPGGFMSMLGVLMLNEVITQRGILDPEKALNHLRQNIISVLHQTGEYTDTGDGMDLSLCIINDEEKTLNYSGANSCILILQKNDEGEQEVIEIYSDRMPISYHLVMKSFTNQLIKLKKGSLLYLFSDGIIDQFGGEQGKKFQLSRFKNFIIENKNLPLETQGIALEQQFDKWKGDTYQVDDVLVLGIKV